ncbi:MAG: hypothetical protein LC643_10095, partial [Bacteroidales bacterium]|nr:hypothetical protein [Bacteroidales bacterium]
NWTATPSESWIKMDQTSGTLTGKANSQQQRLYVSIDWDKAPKTDRLRGAIRFSSGDKNFSLQVYASHQDLAHTSREALFVEDRGYITIHAENFHRQNNTSSYGWDLLEGLGYTGHSVWVNPLKIKEQQFDPELKNPSTIEYDFHTDKGGEITVTVYALPVHPLHLDYSNRIGIGINDETPQIVDHKTFGRSDTWKQNVLSNSAVLKTKHRLSAGGRHTLKIYALDPGIIIDRIVIDKGGAIKTYSAQKETVLKP